MELPRVDGVESGTRGVRNLISTQVGEDREVPVFLGEDLHGDRVLYDALGHVRGGCAGGVAPPLASIADAGVRFCAQINQ